MAFADGLGQVSDSELQQLQTLFSRDYNQSRDAFSFDCLYDVNVVIHKRKERAEEMASANWYSHTKYKGNDVYHGPYPSAEKASEVQSYLHACHRHSSIGIEQHATNPNSEVNN